MMNFYHKIRPHLLYLLILWLLLIGIYLKTVSPSILYVDAGTMVSAAYQLGIPNPPGFPGYMMITHLFTLLPFGTILFRVQLLSIVSAFGILTLVYLLIQRLIPVNQLNKICALASALALAFSYQFWSQTINSESYILTNFFMTVIIFLALTISKGIGSLTKRIILGAVIFGIATGTNPILTQIIPFLILTAVFYWQRIGIKGIVLAGTIIVLMTILVYSYLPIRASQYPFLNWGNPQTFKLFVGHLRGQGLDINDPRTNSVNGFTGSPQIFTQSVGRYLFLLTIQFTPLLLPFIVLGIIDLYRKNRRLWWMLISIPFTNIFLGGLYLSGNQESWFITSYIIFSIFLGIGLSLVLSYLGTISHLNKKFLFLLPVICFLLPLLWWFPKLDRSQHFVTREYENNLYANLPKDAVLIGTGDFFNSMSNYHYSVFGKKDVFPIVSNMWYILPWYRDNLRHQRPDLMPTELETMIKMDRFEEYNEVMNWYIKWLIDHGHPVFVTPMVFRETVLAGTDAGKYKPDQTKLQAIPYGLTMRMAGKDDLLKPSENNLKFNFRDANFFNNPPFYLERNYNSNYNLLLREYGIAYSSMAGYFLDADNLAKAKTYLEKAYQIAPFSSEIVNQRAIVSALEGDNKNALRYFKEASGLEPQNADIRLNLAKAYLEGGKNGEAKQELQNVVNLAGFNPQLQQEAQSELAKIASLELQSNIPTDWKSYKNPKQGFEVRYPSDWDAAVSGQITTLKAPTDNFTIDIYGGKLNSGESGDAWAAKSPLVFNGQINSKGPAQVPPFQASAAIWTETNGKKVIEFILISGRRAFHLKVGPLDSQQMKQLDQILSNLLNLDPRP